jgi:FixJ family two-component response regulator
VVSDAGTVYVIDDDAAMRDALSSLLTAARKRVCACASAGQFLETYDGRGPCCLVLDVRMPGMSGPELQQHLVENGSDVSIIFLTGHGDVQTAAKSMRTGALDFLQKPVQKDDLLTRVDEALARSAEACRKRSAREQVGNCLASLTGREQQVLNLMVTGCSNKVISLRLDIAPRTVEHHKARIMQKMQVDSVPDLVRSVMVVEP